MCWDGRSKIHVDYLEKGRPISKENYAYYDSFNHTEKKNSLLKINY